MRRLFLIAVVITLLAGFESRTACYAQTQPETTVTGSHSSQVGALLAPFSLSTVPGVAVLVVQDGRIVHNKGYGIQAR